MAATMTADLTPDNPQKVISKGREALMNSVEDCLYGSVCTEPAGFQPLFTNE